MANDEARERAYTEYLKRPGHRPTDHWPFCAGYDAAESRIAELEAEVERLKELNEEIVLRAEWTVAAKRRFDRETGRG